MLEYVTLEEQKEYSDIFHCAMDDKITVLIRAYSGAVKNYLGDFSPYQGQRNTDDDFVVDSGYEPLIDLDSEGEQNLRFEVKLAVMMAVDKVLNPRKYPPRTNDSNYLDPEIVQILYPLRDPVAR